MVIKYPEKGLGYYPMAIVDGIVPEPETTIEILELARAVGYSPTLISERAIDKYEGIIRQMNHQPQCPQDKGLCKRHIDHYIIHNLDVKPGPQSSTGRTSSISLHQQIDDHLSRINVPSYCINVMVLPRHDANKQLDGYLFTWLASTRFHILESHRYSNLTTYEALCERFFHEIQLSYDNPINAALRKSDDGSFEGTLITS